MDDVIPLDGGRTFGLLTRHRGRAAGARSSCSTPA